MKVVFKDSTCISNRDDKENNEIASTIKSNKITKQLITEKASKEDKRVEPNGSRVGSDTIDLNYFDISVEQMISKMKNLELGWTPGSDGIPSGFINLCADSLVFPLKIIFNKSLSTGAFPLLWKTADIIPIHKSGSKTVVENYRGISTYNECFS
jgi:hypothetical protein